MVHERDDEYEGQEDGEYHFSDDQANYEVEPEVEKPRPVTAEASAEKRPAFKLDALNKYRRPLMGAAVVFFLIFLVYKIMAPSSSTPASEFAQNTNSTTTTVQKTVTKSVSLPPAHKAEAATVVVQATRPVVTEVAKAPAIVVTQEQPTANAAPVVVSVPMTSNQPTVTQAGNVTVVQQPVQQANQAAEMSPAQTAGAIDKLIALQDQNTKLVNQLQAESAQKIADYEAQNVALQGKVQDMSLRLSSMEATLARLNKLLQDVKSPEPAGSRAAEIGDVGASQPMMARPIISSRSAYTVQAIIPGRAWLKAENGETVTVAEGDTIKNYGRITKIDPYDGVVQIDAGGRLVTLSYGAGTD